MTLGLSILEDIIVQVNTTAWVLCWELFWFLWICQPRIVCSYKRDFDLMWFLSIHVPQLSKNYNIMALHCTSISGKMQCVVIEWTDISINDRVKCHRNPCISSSCLFLWLYIYLICHWLSQFAAGSQHFYRHGWIRRPCKWMDLQVDFYDCTKVLMHPLRSSL